MMSGVALPSSDHHGDGDSAPEGSDATPGDEVTDMELLLDSSQYGCGFSALEVNWEETGLEDGSWSPDGDLEGGGLDRKWLLWHNFMKEHAHLDAWLRLAEQAVASPSPAHFTYSTAKEELRRFERLQREAGSQLVQLDSLTRRNRTLTRMFDGVMRTRLLSSAGECGRRWDNVNQKLESITAGLKLFVSEWEEFEAQGAELALWLADMDVRLSEVDHLTGSTCEKLRQLQSFQQCVCVNSARINALLSRGEDLIQQSAAAGQQVELRLLELLRRCSNVYNNIARMHTRLLSMRLVFEDDWILSQVTDSGCPSENPPEEEEVVEKHLLDLPATSRHPKDPPSSPTHEPLGLEWDPSVDVGRSVSRDDADSSYFSACTGRCHGDGLKRRSYLSCTDSRSDISNDVTNQEVELGLENWLDHSGSFSPAVTGKDQWVTSTPDGQSGEPIGFDGGRVKAWLRVQSSAPPEGHPSSSKAMQTEEVECFLDRSHVSNQLNLQRCQDDTQVLFPDPTPFLSHDLRVKASSDWSVVQAEEEPSCWEETEQRRPRSSRFPPALLSVLLVLLAGLIWSFLDPPCHRSNGMQRSFHLMLRYVNGPPPT
ncbi:nesprin-2 isoform X2 [Amphiprion ocellaris]|uniref:nesprin-2 isoform X2 n=1 Tax=Amphiprion ocellaris TaxID=80972 RepID=UPI000C301F8D|nr:nesprin-2 isoform X2 [Amphiprion ocellaris]